MGGRLNDSGIWDLVCAICYPDLGFGIVVDSFRPPRFALCDLGLVVSDVGGRLSVTGGAAFFALLRLLRFWICYPNHLDVCVCNVRNSFAPHHNHMRAVGYSMFPCVYCFNGMSCSGDGGQLSASGCVISRYLKFAICPRHQSELSVSNGRDPLWIVITS